MSGAVAIAKVQAVLSDPEDVPSSVESLVKNNSNGKDFHQGSEVRIPVPWGTIAGKAWGDPSGFPVLGLHGWMDNAGTFDKLAPLLLKSLFFVAVEMPGHGFSSHYPSGMPYHFVDYVLVVKRIVRHLGWSKFSIIGHSMGAGIGALYSSVFPNEIDQLVLLDLAKPITSGPTSFATKIAIGVDAFLALEDKIDPVPPTYSYFDALDRLIKATQDALSEDAAKTLLVRGSRQVDEDKYCFTRDLRLRSPTLSRFSHNDIYDILGEIRCRVLYLKASETTDFEEPGLQERALEIYKVKCSEFRYVVVQGNHFFHLNDPSEAASIINQFFQQQKAVL